MRTISSTSMTMLMPFAQVAMLLLHAPAALAVSSGPAGKLILGFEQAELRRGAYISREEKPGRESWFYLLERPEGFDFAARFEWPGETNRGLGRGTVGPECTPKVNWPWSQMLRRLIVKNKQQPTARRSSSHTSTPISAGDLLRHGS